MDSNDRRGHLETGPAGQDDGEDEPVAVAALRAELAEAKRIGRWLYNRAPGPRLFLGDVSEWPWLLEPDPEDEAATPRLAAADRDRAVLRAFAVIQAQGDDPYDAEHVPNILRLSATEFDASLYRLLHGGLITGGQLFSRSFVETVTDKGMAAAGMLDDEGRPLRVLRTDLASFSGAGYGTLRIPPGMQLETRRPTHPHRRGRGRGPGRGARSR